MNENPLIKTLRDAVALSPDNLPLRRHFANTLLDHGHFADAETKFRVAATLDPSGNARLEIAEGLAHALAEQGKHDEAPASLSEVMQSDQQIGAKTRLLYTRLLLMNGDNLRAIGEYLQAIDADPTLADPELAAQLGLAPDIPEPMPQESTFDTSSKEPELGIGGVLEAEPSDSEYAFDDSDEADDGIADDVDQWIRLGADGESIDPDSDSNDDEGLDVEMERPQINFTHVGGMKSVKEESISRLSNRCLLHPELY